MRKDKHCTKTRKLFCIVVVCLLVVLLSVVTFFIYEKIRLAKDPYFTEYKLTQFELRTLESYYWINVTPDCDMILDKSDWPDYSYYTIEATEETNLVVFVVNHWLFIEKFDHDQVAQEYAKEYGFSKENPITTEWILQNPREAVKLIEGMRVADKLTDLDFLNWYIEGVSTEEEVE